LDLERFLLLAPAVLLGLTVHEFAHAFIAFRRGDPTARDAGRLTLNPLKHLDLMGTLMLFIVHFGWAKPVPVRADRLHHPRTDMVLVSLAGPFSNLLLAILLGFGLRGFDAGHLQELAGVESIVATILFWGVLINVSLFIFNLLPVPPLDGSRLIAAVVPDRYMPVWQRIERFAAIGLFVLLLGSFALDLGIISKVLIPPVRAVTDWIFYSSYIGGLSG
jgi:Zn-dependent protease